MRAFCMHLVASAEIFISFFTNTLNSCIIGIELKKLVLTYREKSYCNIILVSKT